MTHSQEHIGKKESNKERKQHGKKESNTERKKAGNNIFPLQPTPSATWMETTWMGKGAAGGGAGNAGFGVTACLQCMVLCVNMLQL